MHRRLDWPTSLTTVLFSEKFALFAGLEQRWISRERERELPIVRAHHVNSAVWIPEGEFGELVLSCAAPDLRFGTILSLGKLAAILAHWIYDRR